MADNERGQELKEECAYVEQQLVLAIDLTEWELFCWLGSRMKSVLGRGGERSEGKRGA